MMTIHKVLEIRRLLSDPELTQRDVAERLRISVGTVNNVARDLRKLENRLAGAEPTLPDQVDDIPSRCNGCGGTVYKPCRLCWVRAVEARERMIRDALQIEDLGIRHAPNSAA